MAIIFGMPYYRLFVLGAGFSKPAGLPLADKLLHLVREDVKGYSQRHSRWDGALEEEIQEWTALYPGQPVDLERVLAYSHRKHYLRLLGSDEYFAHGSRSIVAARRAIQRILIDSTPTNAPSLYRKFAERLSPDDVVMTFNYDTLLEQTLDAIGKPYTLTPEWWLSEDLPEAGQQYVDLLKLHGSIDWYDRKYHDDAVHRYLKDGHSVPDRDPIFGPNPLVKPEPLSKGKTDISGSNILPRVFRIPDHSKHFPLDNRPFSDVVPFLLPMAYDKLLGHDVILDFWENLHRTTHQFSAIVVIGYSLPSHDSYAYEALGRLFVDYQQRGQKTQWGHRRVPIQIISLEESSKHVMRNFPFLCSAKTRVWHEGFSDQSLDWLDWGDGNPTKQRG